MSQLDEKHESILIQTLAALDDGNDRGKDVALRIAEHLLKEMR